MHRADSRVGESREEYLCELISSQVHFGLAYVRQARSAHEDGRGEHREIARSIAMNAYSTANRFASRLIERTGDARLNGIEALRLQIESVWPDSTFARQIAS